MSDLKDWTIGFIGLGLMGAPMARHLARAGARVLVHNRSPAPVAAAVADGLTAAEPGAMAQRCDAIVVMVSDTPAVRRILVGAAADGTGPGLLATAKPGTILVDMGTTAVSDTKEFARSSHQRGLRWIDRKSVV